MPDSDNVREVISEMGIFYSRGQYDTMYRKDGPAEIIFVGHTVWYDDNGEIHRDNGPAIIYADGSMLWYNHGDEIETRDEYTGE